MKIKISNFFFIVASFGLLFSLILSGCTQGERLNIKTSLESVESNTLTRIQDIPFLPKSKIDVEASLIMGEGKNWSGQLLVYTPEKKREVFNFYVENFPNYGWKEQTTIRGKVSILNYVGENNRVAIISIREQKRLLSSSEVLVTVSPYTDEFEEKVGDFINEEYLELPFKN